MIELFFFNCRAYLPTFTTNCPDESHFAAMGSHFAKLPRIPPPTLFSTQQSHTPFANMYIQKTTPTPPQNTPFPVLNLKLGKMNYCPSVPLTTTGKGRAWLRTQKPLNMLRISNIINLFAKNFQYYQFGIKYYNSRTDSLLVFIKY